MGLRNSPFARKAFIALLALALAAGAVFFAYRAGCMHTGAGSSVASHDHQFFSIWLMIPSLVLFAVLFAIPVSESESPLRPFLRAGGFLLLAFPLAIGVLMYAESEGDQHSQNCARNPALSVAFAKK